MLEVQKALNKFAKDVVIGAKREITRQGKGGGDLSRMLDYDLKTHKNSFSLDFVGAPYMDFVDRGVKGAKENKYPTAHFRFGTGSFKGKTGKGGKFDMNIRKWINKKRLRLRGKDGKFVKNGVESLSYLIRRDIYRKGIKPSLFFTKPFEKHFKNLPDELQIAYALDVEDFINYTFRDNGTNL